MLTRNTNDALPSQAADLVLAAHAANRADYQHVSFTEYVLERSTNDTARGFRALKWKPGNHRLRHHADLINFEDVEPQHNDDDDDNNDSYMNGVSAGGMTRGAAGRISTANGLVLFCTAVCDALVRFEKARGDKAAADADAAAQRAAQLASEMDVSQALHRLGFVTDINKPLTADVMKAFIRAQRQLDGVPKVNKTGNRDTLLGNTRLVLVSSSNLVLLRANELEHNCRQCAKPYDAAERDASGDGLKWVGCEETACGAWFCPSCAPDENGVPAHAHSAASSAPAAMPPPPPPTPRARQRSLSFASTSSTTNNIHSTSTTTNNTSTTYDSQNASTSSNNSSRLSNDHYSRTIDINSQTSNDSNSQSTQVKTSTPTRRKATKRSATNDNNTPLLSTHIDSTTTTKRMRRSSTIYTQDYEYD